MATLHPLAMQRVTGFVRDLDIALQLAAAHADEQHCRYARCAHREGIQAAVTALGGQVHAPVGRIEQRAQLANIRRAQVLHGIGGGVAQLRQRQHRRGVSGIGHRGIPELRRIDARARGVAQQHVLVAPPIASMMFDCQQRRIHRRCIQAHALVTTRRGRAIALQACGGIVHLHQPQQYRGHRLPA
ncbi:hypothetical protein G6F50_014373 [Rhizopus delemar]|uniref:Uncharacterized protein n=1 Tax=Rhizopus delemar TaxID=936053 RepID=A0A9P6Y664_9FUNG|nr:hypothetical protein G6F50_014373 [Rhizopus delemar]